MNKRHWKYSLIISVLVGGIFTLGQSIIFGGGVMYLYDSDYKDVNEMNYSDAREYLAKRTNEISGFESFRNGLKYPSFWKDFVLVWIYYSVMGLICCLLFSKYHYRKEDS